ncbi:hypothetical protein DSO57_1007559 [Entomophthora muscae]|uniref:Uncharacterized protein n=1 Tax=Entomophthora muscae TaxID=34485 RepID=A0ACC2RM90_9FUNG|nr:hypothetical protein DSO57_1007559 [Entomophthora muscae]
MDRGLIVEKGTHSELMILGGAYYNLVNLQNSRPADSISASSEALYTPTYSYEEEMSSSELLSAEDGRPPRVNLFKSVGEIVKLNFPEILFNLGGTMGAFLLGLMNFILGIILFTSMQRAMQLMIDRKPLGEEAQKLFHSLSSVATLAGISQVACILGLGVAAEKLSSRLRLLLMKAILKQEVGWFDLEANSVGVLVTTASSIPQKITTFSGTSLGAFINVGVNIIASSAIGFYFNAKITLLMLLFLPILCGMALLSMSLMARFSKKSKVAYDESTQMACENVSQMRTVASLAKEEHIFDKYCFNQKRALKEGYKNAFITTISLSLSASVLPLIIVIAAFLSASFELDSDVFKNTTAFLGICIIMLVFTLVISDATRKMPLVPGIKQATDGAKGFCSMLQREPRINLLPDGPGKFVEVDSEEFGEIAFNQVQFSYPTRLHIPSLRGISFQARRGQYIALVGPSGCGKSTSIGLIERFYDVIHGSITLDGVDIRALHLPSYRDHIALVGQEPALFNLSIKDNILMGARTYGPTPDMDDVITAAKASNIHDFIMSLPNNYNTMVGGKGTHLSGGQKQRIAIARALIRDPQILLLDEATSALDAESEKVVQAALDRASQGRTTIAIAHRLSTIKNADLILVMKDGLIVERGTHQELVDLNGLYAEMAIQQSLN